MTIELETVSYIDVGYGKPVTLSSTHGKAPHLLLPARIPGSLFCHTEREQDPYLVIDLQTVRAVRRIRIFNTESAPDRCLPLSVSASFDNENWHMISYISAMFGGRVTGTPWILMFSESVRCRYLRLQTLNETWLHLDYVEICAHLPKLELGRWMNVRISDDDILAEYYHHDSHGFCWTFTCALILIIGVVELGISVTRVDFSLCMIEFKDIPGTDIYPVLFKQVAKSRQQLPGHHVPFERHGIYSTFDLGQLNRYVDAYFRPSERVRAFSTGLIAKYNLEMANVIALVYRGTDKSIEIVPADIDRYIVIARHLLETRPGMRLIVQTDQAQVLDRIKDAFPDATSFDELPVTSGKIAIHNLEVKTEFGISRSELGVRLLAMITLLARSGVLITHTGNLGAWLALYRGSNRDMYQFDAEGALRGPDGEILPGY